MANNQIKIALGVVISISFLGIIFLLGNYSPQVPISNVPNEEVATGNFIPNTISSTTVKTTTNQCDNSLWDHVYHPQRLEIIANCTTVSGTIEKILKEADGDYHIRLRLDPEFTYLVNDANEQYQY